MNRIAFNLPRLAAPLALGLATLAPAQTCTTQAKMPAELRTSISDQALALASSVKANASSRIEAESIPELTTNFAPTDFLIRSTSEKIAADSLRVYQVYLLDASARAANDRSEASFTCPLTGTTSEVDFDIPALPAGKYAFAIVLADGPRPWMMSFVLEQQGSAWKLAGFYSHAYAAAGHDGLWYWHAARDAAKAQQLWRAWLLYAEAAALLRPAPFLDSSLFDKLVSEQRTATPPELSQGISDQTPLVVTAKDAKGAAAEFRFTSIAPDVSDDGRELNLVLHIRAEATPDAAAGHARNLAAARALLDAHKELRTGFDGVWVYADIPGQPPFGTHYKIAEIP